MVQKEISCFMTDNDKKEQLSFAYLQAVVLQAGGSVDHCCRLTDNMGIDVSCTFDSSGICSAPGFPKYAKLSIQLKATSSPKNRKEYYALPIDRVTYEKYQDLSCDSRIPFFVFLYVLPKNQDEWLHFDDGAIIKGKMYWAYIDCEDTSCTLRFYKDNVVDVDGLKTLILYYDKRGKSGYGA